MQKALTPEHPSENDRFATYCSLTTTRRRAGENAAGCGMEISSDKSKILVNSIQPILQ